MGTKTFTAFVVLVILYNKVFDIFVVKAKHEFWMSLMALNSDIGDAVQAGIKWGAPTLIIVESDGESAELTLLIATCLTLCTIKCFLSNNQYFSRVSTFHSLIFCILWKNFGKTKSSEPRECRLLVLALSSLWMTGVDNSLRSYRHSVRGWPAW